MVLLPKSTVPSRRQSVRMQNPADWRGRNESVVRVPAVGVREFHEPIDGVKW